jgi:hypothetical protein
VSNPSAAAPFVRQLSGCSALAALLAALAAPSAASADSKAEIRELMARISHLEKRVAARDKAAKAQQHGPGSNAAVVVKGEQQLPDRFYFKGVTIKPGGYFAMDTIWRKHWMGADTGTPFQNIPYGSQAVGQAEEFRLSARESRLSLLTQGNVNPQTHLTGYVEIDFLGAAQTANSNQTNSYNPRIRQLWWGSDWDEWGLHFVAGQPWSLVTLNSNGIKPDALSNPPLIDGNLMVGYTYVRDPGLRLVKDLPYNFTAAFAVEASATTFVLPGSNDTPAKASTVAGVPVVGTTGIIGPLGVTTATPILFGAPFGGGLFNSANVYSFNRLPDFIGKLAWDEKILDHKLHVEGFGLLRDFTDRVYWGNHSVWGGGVGGGFVFGLLPDLLDVQGNLLIGKGVGRYGPAQMADATYSITGAPLPNYQRIFNVGVTAHLTPRTDVFVFAGGEFQGGSAQYGALGKTLYVGGLGNPLYNNSGCAIEAPSNYGLTNPAGITTCSGQFKAVREITSGVWHTFYQGDFGKLRAGAIYTYLVKDAFPGVGPTPKAIQNQVMTTLRYYPF